MSLYLAILRKKVQNWIVRWWLSHIIVRQKSELWDINSEPQVKYQNCEISSCGENKLPYVFSSFSYWKCFASQWLRLRLKLTSTGARQTASCQQKELHGAGGQQEWQACLAERHSGTFALLQSEKEPLSPLWADTHSKVTHISVTTPIKVSLSSLFLPKLHTYRQRCTCLCTNPICDTPPISSSVLETQFFWIESQFVLFLHVTPDRLMMIRSDLCVSDKNLTRLLQLMAKLMFGNVNWYFLLTHYSKSSSKAS